MANPRRSIIIDTSAAPVETEGVADLSIAILGKITRIMADVYRWDACSPGVLISFLVDKNQYYASLHRYLQGGGHGKQIVATALGDTPSEAVKSLAKAWLTTSEKLSKEQRDSVARLLEMYG